MNVGEVLGNVLRGRNRAEEGRSQAVPEQPEKMAQTAEKEVSQGFKLLAECLRILHGSDSLIKAIQQITALTGQYMQAEQSWCFWLKDEVICNSFQWSLGELRIPEVPAQELGRLHLDLWDSFFDGREYLVVPDIAEAENITDTLKGRFAVCQIESLVLIPMYYQEQLLQVIVYNNIKEDLPELAEFTDALYCMLNMCVGRVFERKRNFELTYYDTLTGLYNRAKFWKDMHNVSEEDRKNTGIVQIHMRHLRRVNEEQGHEAGNQMLKRFAARIDEIMPGEIAYRIGGSEFVLWMQHLEQAEFVDKVMSLKDALGESEQCAANVAARWEEYASDMCQLARQTDEELYQQLEADERKMHFR